MNEENKIPGVPGEEIDAPVNEENAGSLNEELETLRETFQEKYDETVEEAASMPVIQELEEGEEEEEPEEENEESAAVTVQEKAPKKKMKPGKIVAITIPVVLLVAVVGALLAYVVASMTNPNFSSFVSAYAQATAATEYDEKMECLEKALSYCSDKDSAFQQAMAATIREEIAVAVYEEEGYAAAYSYMTSEMSEDQIKNPSGSAFRKIVKIADSVNKLALQSFEAVYENIGESGELLTDDALDIPEELEEDILPVLSGIGEGYAAANKAQGIEESLRAMNYFANAYSAFVSLGADSRELAEKIVVVTYNQGYELEAVSFSSIAVDPSKENVNKDYTALQEELAAYGKLGISVISVAEEALAAEKVSAQEVLALVKTKAEMTDKQAEIAAAVVVYAIEGIKAEKEKNLTRATTVYATLTSVLEAFGMDDVNAHLKTASVIFESGNLNDSSTLVSTYLTDEAMKDATEEQKAQRDRMDSVFKALSATSEVFSPYYSAYYQQGTAIDMAALKEELNKLVTDESDSYLEGFINYCLYIAAISTNDEAAAKDYLDKMSSLMPDLPFVFGYSYIAEYINEGNFNAAYNYALKLLDINVADEYANSVVALYERVRGNLDNAEAAALKGIELSGSESSDCAQQLAIINMLKGDFETAFGYVAAVYNANQSMESFELVLIFNALYKGDNSDLKTSLNEMVSIVNQTYSYYGISSYAETKAIIDGTKTLEDVFMSGDYTITAEE